MEDLGDIRWDWEEDGRLVRRELDRRIFERGGWATALFLYQELDLETDAWRPARVAIVRFKKARGLWHKHAAWNLAGADEAREVAAALGGWFDDDARAARDEP